jgi:hypothetical protein
MNVMENLNSRSFMALLEKEKPVPDIRLKSIQPRQKVLQSNNKFSISERKQR